MRSARAAAVALALLLPSPAAADIFVLKDGKQIDGFPAGVNAKKELILGTDKGPRTVAQDRVKEVRPSADARADYLGYSGGLGPMDADGAAALGSWARERGLPEEAEEAFRRALEIRPDHPVAREGLGWILVDGKWLSPEEAAAYRLVEDERSAFRAKYEEMMGRRPEVHFTAHWQCVDFLADGKEAARLADLEKAWDESVRVLGDDPWKGRGLVVSCKGVEQYHAWLDKDARKLPGFSKMFMEFALKATGIKWTQPPVLGRSDAPSRTAMHAADVHSSGHLLIHNWKGVNRDLPFWVEEGFGGWMEQALLKTNSSFCWAVPVKAKYGMTVRDPGKWEADDPDWKALCKQAAARDEFLTLAELDALPAGQYSRREVGQSFSLVAYLLREKGVETFRAYVAEVKRGTKSSAAFRQAYRLGLAEIEPEWKAWLIRGAW